MTVLYFFLGTEAELIKMFPVIMEAKRRSFSCRIIASGQNDIVNSIIFKKSDCGPVDFVLSSEKDIKKSAAGLLTWWIRTYHTAVHKIKNAFPEDDFSKGIMIVHGDTVSTFMGAMIGKRLGMKVCHVEAGLRSFNLLSPFPEEIDRLLTSGTAGIHFAPGEEPFNNLKRAKGIVINTKQNTLLDSLRYSQTLPIENETIRNITGMKYFVFVMHRQENLIKKSFVKEVVTQIIKISAKYKCVLLLHKITENTFNNFGLMNAVKNDPNIILFSRVDYFDFMKLLQNALFAITDGGSNQEELYYMKKPCLVLRTATERKEGLGINARLFNGDPSDITNFVDEYEKGVFDLKGDIADFSPSKLIIDSLMEITCKQ